MKSVVVCVFCVFLVALGPAARAECPGGNCGQTQVRVENETYTLVNAGSGPGHVQTTLYPGYPGYGPVNLEYNKWVSFRADLVIDPGLLLSKAELEEWLPHFKYGKLFRLPDRQGPEKMFRLAYGRPNPGDTVIADPVLASADGGDPLYTERVLLSFAWHHLKARRFSTEIFIFWEPHASGLALPAGGNFSKIATADSAFSAAVAPMLGTAWTKISLPYKMRLKAYNDGEVWLFDPSSAPPMAPPMAEAPPMAPPMAEDIPVRPLMSIFFDTDKAEIRPSEQGKIAEAAGYLKANLAELRQSGQKLLILAQCDVRHDTSYNDHLGGNRAERTKKAILAAYGAGAEQAAEYLLFATSGKRTAAPGLDHDDRRADIYLVKKISAMAERNTAK